MAHAKLEIKGNLGSDPETKYTPNGTMLVELRVAVNDWRKPEDGPTWYRVSAWDRLAERLDKLAAAGSLGKGSSVQVTGNFTPHAYTANDGTERVSFDLTAYDFEFGNDKRQDAPNDGPSTY
jgi:single-strand DNA-binding protein